MSERASVLPSSLPPRGEAVICPDCNRECANIHGYQSHWAQRHWQPNKRVRPEPIPTANTDG